MANHRDSLGGRQRIPNQPLGHAGKKKPKNRGLSGWGSLACLGNFVARDVTLCIAAQPRKKLRNKKSRKRGKWSTLQMVVEQCYIFIANFRNKFCLPSNPAVIPGGPGGARGSATAASGREWTHIGALASSISCWNSGMDCSLYILQHKNMWKAKHIV